MTSVHDDTADPALRARLAAFVDGIDIPAEGDAPARPARGHRPRRPRPVALLAAAASLLLLLGVLAGTAALRGGLSPVPAAAGAPVTVPPRLAAYSHLRIPQALAPVGPLLAVYAQGTGAEFFDHPRHVALGADARRYRSLGSVPPGVLSPGGDLLASDSTTGAGRVTVVAAADGSRRDIEIPGTSNRTVRPVSWSPDGRSVFVVVSGPDTSAGGSLLRVDVEAAAGTAPAITRVPGIGDAVDAAPSPDGRRLALTRPRGRIDVVDATTGRTLRTVAPALAPRLVGTYDAAGETATRHAWSPDGRWIVRTQQELTTVVDTSGSLVGTDLAAMHLVAYPAEGGPPSAHRLPLLSAVPVVWTGPDAYVLSEWLSDGSGGQSARLVEVDIRTGSLTVLTQWEFSWTGAGVYALDIAPDLAWGWRTQRTPWTPWPENAQR